MSDILHTTEWRIAERMLTPIKARRTGVSHFQHIVEGVSILVALEAPMYLQKAFVIHPLMQRTRDFQENLCLLEGFDPLAVGMAVEYRAIANQGTREIVKANDWQIVISEFSGINLMLRADKIQNRKSFLEHFTKDDPDYADLDHYFKCWLTALAVSEAEYRTLVNGLFGHVATAAS